ncbi:hypothetical protein HDU97_006512 [Phlyctochytrium planicorne]|nr:hypothetical protein HDU97_006512 [Phlyctochytrium planicorne]
MAQLLTLEGAPYPIPTAWAYKPGSDGDITNIILEPNGKGSILEGRGQRIIITSNFTYTVTSLTTTSTVLSSISVASPPLRFTLSITFDPSDPKVFGAAEPTKCGVPTAFTFEVTKHVLNKGFDMKLVHPSPYDYLCGDDKDTFSVLVGHKDGVVFYGSS